NFVTYCPGGKTDKGTLVVAAGGTSSSGDAAEESKAVDTYRTYAETEVDQLIADTTRFVDTVKAGDVALAQRLFAPARTHYETIEPVAESFGDLDPAIDIREPDVEKPEDFTGFHRIEKALWVENNVSDMGPVADKLVADIATLKSKVNTIELEPATIANGAVELLNEVSTSKITGEEDAFSHTDLSDFAANLAGAKAAFESVKPLLASSDTDLSAQIEQRFTDVQTALDKYKGSDPTGNGYVLYTTLTPDDTRSLSTVLDTLAEPLSTVAAHLL
ncbi:MAG TPA: iron uptake system protein EfeO, partial [Acidimicrobiales bacterium]